MDRDIDPADYHQMTLTGAPVDACLPCRPHGSTQAAPYISTLATPGDVNRHDVTKFVLPSWKRIYEWFHPGVTRGELETYVRRHLATAKPEYATAAITLGPTHLFEEQTGRLATSDMRVQLSVDVDGWN
jgi:hypothetical protein